MKVSLSSPKKVISFLGESTDSVMKLAHNFQVSIQSMSILAIRCNGSLPQAFLVSSRKALPSWGGTKNGCVADYCNGGKETVSIFQIQMM